MSITSTENISCLARCIPGFRLQLTSSYKDDGVAGMSAGNTKGHPPKERGLFYCMYLLEISAGARNVSSQTTVSLRVHRRKCQFGRADSLLDFFLSMSDAEKCSLELRRRQIYSAIEHGAEESAEGFGVRLRRRVPVGYRAGSKKPGKH